MMASAAAWVLLNRRSLPGPVVSSLMRSVMINFLLIAMISMVPRVSGLAHYGGAAVGAAFSLILNVERYGYGWRRTLAVLGLMLVPVVCIGWLNWAMETTAPWQRLIQRDRRGQVVQEGPVEQQQIEKESREFNEQYLPKIEEKIRAARKLYLGQSVILLNEPPRNPADTGLKKSRETLAKERQELTELAAQLQKAGPYETLPLESARQIGLEYVEGWAKVLELTEKLLQPGDEWPKKKEALDQQYRQVGEIGQRWRDLLRPKS